MEININNIFNDAKTAETVVHVVVDKGEEFVADVVKVTKETTEKAVNTAEFLVEEGVKKTEEVVQTIKNQL